MHFLFTADTFFKMNQTREIVELLSRHAVTCCVLLKELCLAQLQSLALSRDGCRGCWSSNWIHVLFPQGLT